MSDKWSLREQVALVTGAGRGIGRAIALALAGAGADLILLARTAAELAETAAQVRALGRAALPIAADVSRCDEAQEAVAQGLHRFGQVDILVNCAGQQGPIGPLAENDPAAWAQTVSVNLLGAVHVTQAVLRGAPSLPGMIARRRGKIINLSGGGATGPRPNFSAYAASKAAVVRLTETLAEELRPYNIQVNAIAPGIVKTRMVDEMLAAGAAAGAELAALQKRLGQGSTPVELPARLVLFLASAASDGLTGKLISAPHDDWESWDEARLAELDRSPWYTLRRLDPYTVRPLLERLR